MKRVILAFGTSIAIQILGMASGLLAARVLGPELRGELAGVVSLISALSTVGALGLADATVFRISLEETREVRNNIVLAALLASLCTATVTMAAAMLIAPKLLHIEGSNALLLFIPNILLNQASVVIVARAQASHSPSEWSLYRMLPTLCGIPATILLLSTHRVAKLDCFLIGLMTGNLAIIFWNFGLLREIFAPTKAVFREIRGLLSYGIRLHPAAVMGAMRENLDRVLMGAVLPAAALGYYAVAATLAATLMTIGVTVDMIALPKLSAQTTTARKKMFLAYAMPALLLILLAANVVGFSSSFLVPALFGADFSPAAPLTPIFAVAYAAAAAKAVIGTSLKAAGRPGLIGAIELATTLLFAVTLPAAVLTYGAAGAATTAAIIQSASMALFAYFSAKHYELKLSDLRIAIRDARSLTALALMRVAKRSVI